MRARDIAKNKDGFSVDELERIIIKYGNSKYTKGYLKFISDNHKFHERRKYRLNKEFNKFLDKLTLYTLNNKDGKNKR